MTAFRDGQALTVIDPRSQALPSRWALHEKAGGIALEWYGPCAGEPDECHLLAALDAVFSLYPRHTKIGLGAPLPASFFHAGIVELSDENRLVAERGALWQQSRLWRAHKHVPYPQRYMETDLRRHPKRPPKPSGIVYQRHIPDLGQTFALRSVNVVRDAETFAHWVDNAGASCAWQRPKPIADHRAYLDGIAEDAHRENLIACLDGQPFAYFETCWAKEDGGHSGLDAADYDRGWRVLINDVWPMGHPSPAAWLPCVAHHLFLDDCRTQRVIADLGCLGAKMRAVLEHGGYLQAQADKGLGLLSRERFFERMSRPPETRATPPDSIPKTLIQRITGAGTQCNTSTI